MTIHTIYNFIGSELTHLELMDLLHSGYKHLNAEEQENVNDELEEILADISFSLYEFNNLQIKAITHDVQKRLKDPNKQYIIGKVYNTIDIDCYSQGLNTEFGYSLSKFLQDTKYVQEYLNELNIKSEIKLYSLQNDCRCCS